MTGRIAKGNSRIGDKIRLAYVCVKMTPIMNDETVARVILVELSIIVYFKVLKVIMNLLIRIDPEFIDN